MKSVERIERERIAGEMRDLLTAKGLPCLCPEGSDFILVADKNADGAFAIVNDECMRRGFFLEMLQRGDGFARLELIT